MSGHALSGEVIIVAFSRRQFVAGLAACPACLAGARSASAEGAHWTYADPRNWGVDKPSPASSIGDEQSPMDLRPPANSCGNGAANSFMAASGVFHRQ